MNGTGSSQQLNKHESDDDGARANVMLVDDNRSQIKLLTRMVQDMGHTARPFTSGRMALEAAIEDPPDILLLDINMPAMSGYEVCRSLKQHEQFVDLPVIFISASGDVSDKIEAFDAGGIDFINKPFRLEEVKARIQTHLKLRRLNQQLENTNRRLEDLVAERTRQLNEAHQRLSRLDQAKSDFLKMISHELRTPLNGVLGISSIIFRKCQAEPTVAKFTSAFQAAQNNLLEIIDDALLLTEMQISGEARSCEHVNLAEFVENATRQATKFALPRTVAFADPVLNRVEIEANPPLIARALASIFETAIMMTAEGERITAQIDSQAPPRLHIETRGIAVSEHILDQLFEVFSVAKTFSHGGDLGLRPVVAERIIRLHGGSILLTRLQPTGVRFTIEFPSSEQAL